MNRVDKDFWKYISLGILGMIGSAGTILTDAFFASDRLGSNGLAAMNLAMCVFGLMNGTGLLFGIGGATRFTIFKSREKHQNANSAFTLSFFAAEAVGLIYALIGLFFSRPLSVFLGADASTFTMCNTYLKTVLCFAPAFVLNHLLMAFVRNDGDPNRSMSAMFLGSISNIILDYVFMYPLDMGIFGAALATGIAALIGISISASHFLSVRNQLRFVHIKNANPAEIFQIISAGLASFITEFSSGIVLVIFNLLILNSAGTIAVAAYGVVANLALMILAIMSGISHGIQPLISKLYGAGRHADAKKLYHKGIRLTCFIGLATFSLVFLFSPNLVQCFNGERNPQLQQLAETGMRLYFLGFLFAGCNHLTAAYFSAAEKPGQAFIVALFRGLIGISAAACLLSALWGMTGIWLAFPLTEALTLFLCLLFNGVHALNRCGRLSFKLSG